MIHLIGIPHDDHSSFLKGAALGPLRLRQVKGEGSSNPFSENGMEITEGRAYVDAGDMELEGLPPSQAFEKIRGAAARLLQAGDRLLSVGGDHSVTYPVVSAYIEKYGRLNILQLDAHPDLYDRYDDNPYSHASVFARIMETGKIGSLTQVGVRSVTSHQRAQAQKFRVRMVGMKDLDTGFVSGLSAPLYVSLDMDVLDPACAPGVSHHEPGGMTTRQLVEIIQSIPVEIIGADIVEYNPRRDHHSMTAMVVYKLMKELIARMSGS